MPRELFYKLSEKKKNRLFECAKDEFTDYSFEDASINRIIQNAKISRGSFYLYFKNKLDIYFYVLSENRNLIVNNFVNAIENKESIFDVFLGIYDMLIKYIYSSDRKFVEKIIVNLNPKTILYFLSGIAEREMNFSIDYQKLADYDKLNINSKSDLIDILEMLTTITITEFCMVFLERYSEEDGKNHLFKKFNCLKNSIYRTDM